jgi:pyruvate formate lyase activating enzyme
MKGLIFDIKRFSVHDGPGIRTTVFMKGCPLACWWCHNPESRSSECESYIETHSLDGKEFKKEDIIGKLIESEDLLMEIEKDLVFMNESGGGVTFSGGEPLQQPEFLEEILSLCHSNNIQTAIDTSGFAPRGVVERIIPLTNLFLFDLKLLKDDLHIHYTGLSNKIILENLSLIAEAGKRIWIRLPMIENVNDMPEDVQSISIFLQSLPGAIEAINILPYHVIGKGKYNKFGKENKMGSIGNYPVHKSEKILKFFMNEGFKVKIGG